MSLNDQLLEQVQETNVLIRRVEKGLEESKTSHTEPTDEQPVTSRDLLELLREITSRREQQMKFIEEKKEYDVSKEEIQQLIEETVGDRVDTELKSMLSAEGSFAKELAHLIDRRLKTLFSGGESVMKPHAAKREDS